MLVNVCFYLQNIFLGEDIRKQLPRESAEFDDVNSNWKVKLPEVTNTSFFGNITHILCNYIFNRLSCKD